MWTQKFRTWPKKAVILNNPIRNFPWRLFIAWLLLIPLGLGTKFYRGVGQYWIEYFAGGVLYVVFGIVTLALLTRRASNQKIVLIVFGITCTLEFLQLWHPPFLQHIRSYFLGRMILGTTFSWWDFPHYVFGAVVGWVLLKSVHRL